VSGPVGLSSVPIEFPRKFISVNPYEFPRKCNSVNSLTAIRVPAGAKNSRPVGFLQ